MSISKVGDDNLYVSGFISLSNGLALKNANITHVVTVMKGGSTDHFRKFKHHIQIDVDDIDDEDLLQHFPATNAFIQSGLESGDGVLVHCAMGKSRSATVCIAFLLHRYLADMDPHKALELLRLTRPMCEPNPGFMEQLHLYHSMGCPENVVDHPLYQRWLYRRAVEESVACGRGPELDEIRFEDRTADTTKNSDQKMEVKCRRCRRQLASLPFVIRHETHENQNKHRNKNSNITRDGQASSTCAHIFLHPLTWMRPSLFPTSEDSESHGIQSESPLSGRLVCPNNTCGANIGKFAWPGMQCSCGTWVVPAIALARARVDVVDSDTLRAAVGSAAGIRMPPGMRSIVQKVPLNEEKGLL